MGVFLRHPTKWYVLFPLLNVVVHILHLYENKIDYYMLNKAIA